MIQLPFFYNSLEVKKDFEWTHAMTINYDLVQNKNYIPTTFYKQISQIWTLE